MSEYKMETTSWFSSTSVSVERYFLWTSLALVVLFAWMEPSGAAGIGFWKGLIFWAIQISILIPLLITVQHLTSHYVQLQTPHTPWIQTALSGVVASLLFVPIGYLLDILFAIPDDIPSTGIVLGLIDEASGVLVPVTVTWLALNAPWIFQLDFSRRHATPPGQQGNHYEEALSCTPERPTRFLQELGSRASGDLISISSELHYLRVVTTDAEVMFLYNLKDAIDELPTGAGVQIHRSHWVSREHMKAVTKKNGIAECMLSNGARLPVSRRKYSEVKEMLAPAFF